MLFDQNSARRNSYICNLKNIFMENVFIHQVYFWLNNPTSTTDRDKLIAGLRKLSSVKSIQQYHIGIPADTNRPVIDSSYAVSLLLTLKVKNIFSLMRMLIKMEKVILFLLIIIV
jgi:hypothetical protein